MKANNFNNLRHTGLLTGVLIALSGVTVLGAETPQTDAFPVFDSYIKITGQAASISGNGASFESRAQQPENGAGGIEALRYAKDLGNDRSMLFEGKALAGVEDYLGKLMITKAEFGSFEIGYKRFRTFYDGIGGFFPTSGYWMPLNPENLHVDRGEFWVGAKLALPDRPEIEVRYSNSTRNGQKDSTTWGRSDFTGLSNLNAPISPARGMYPAYRDLNERHELLEGSVKGTAGRTSYQLQLLSDWTNDSGTRYAVSYPGEIRLYPNPPSGTLLAPQNVNNEQTITDVSGMKTNSWAAIGNAQTELTDKVKLISGISYVSLDADMTGSRPLVTRTPTKVGVVLDNDNNFANLVGTSTSDVTTARLGFDYKSDEAWSMKVMLKNEHKTSDSAVTYDTVNSSVNSTTGAVTTTTTTSKGYSHVKENSWTPDVDLRYTGIARMAFYGSFTKKFVDGDENVASPYSSAAPSVSGQAIQDVSEDRAKYVVGVVWNTSPSLTLRGEVFYKDNTNHVTGYDIRAGDNYQLDTQFTGIKLTAVAKPSAFITFTTRYVHQKGESQVTGFLPNFPAYDALNQKIHSINETIDWTPNDQFYMQANLSLVYNVLGTIYPRAGITPAGSNPAWNTNGVLQNADNNYVSGSIVAGTTLSKTDDFQICFRYYKANNYNPELAAYTMPYGASVKDVSVTAGVKHKFSDRVVGDVKVGYFDCTNVTTGGNTDFRGPVGYVSLTYGL